jgi:hypothetical protein
LLRRRVQPFRGDPDGDFAVFWLDEHNQRDHASLDHAGNGSQDEQEAEESGHEKAPYRYGAL